MKTNLRFLAVAAAILSVLSCTREIENIDREEAPQTLHYVHFIADAPETKTNLEISQDGTVSYSWTASDECAWISEGDCRWTITNKTNGETAQEITAALTDGVLALTAGFSSEVTAGDVLFAQYNKSVSSTQNYVSESKYHQESDVMISNEIVVQDGDNSNTDYYFSFKRRVAFAKMTLKGLNPNDKVSKVTIESDKAIAGTYNSETDSFDSSSSNSIVINDILEKIDENGTATIYFAVVPVEDANLTVTVETVTEEGAVANTYRKTFVRPISFVTGDVRSFGVAMKKLGWVKTDISAISASDIVVIVGSNYGIRNDEGTSDSPDVVSVTISNNKITSVVPDNIKWNISGNSTDGYVFYPNGNSDKWLYCNTTQSSGSNNNIRVGTGDRKQWKPDENGYFVNTVGGTQSYVKRVLSINGTSDWRSYINTDNNPQKLEFYVLKSAGSSEGGGETGGGEESNVYLSEDFASLEKWETSSISSFVLTSGTWTASGSVYKQNGCIKIGSKTATGNNSITTPALSSISGTADVVLTFKAVSSDSGYTMSVVANNAGTVGELSPSSITQNGTAINNGSSTADALAEAFAASTATFTVTITGATSATTLTIKTSGSSKRWYLDDVKVVPAN